jgi:U3 small nucleolar ribonucleoprotein component
MFIYIVVALGSVLMTSALLMFILYKLKQLNYRMILAVSLSSLLACILAPGLFNFISGYLGGTDDLRNFTLVMLVSILVYIILITLLSIIITMIIPDRSFAFASTGEQKLVENIQDNVETNIGNSANEIILNADANYLEEIYNRHLVENAQNEADTDIKGEEAENNLEISVDSEKIIDKMGVEAFKQDNAANLSVEECVEEGFRLKMLGDMEGAILYFMYALDKNPGKELVFWVVLDICVLYKSLGQVEFAKEMLSGYYDAYGDLMDIGIKDEIEKNLASIEA